MRVQSKTSCISGGLPVRCGVPQGSVLGPLLFTLYVSDFGRNLQFCKYNYYTDDLLIYIHTKPTLIHEAITKLNLDIDNVVKWATSNKLTLNAGKTSAMIFGTRRYVGNLVRNKLPSVVVDGVEIPYSDSVVYLGVTLTNSLSWDDHVTRTVSRMNSSLHQLKTHKNLLSTKLWTHLVSLLIPHFDYCCTLLTNISDKCNLRLQQSFNMCIRFIFDVKWYEHISSFYENLR